MARPAEPPTLRRFLVVTLLLAALVTIAANVVLQVTGLKGPSWLLGWLIALASAFIVGAFLALILLKPRESAFAVVGLREREVDGDSDGDIPVGGEAGHDHDDVVVAEVAPKPGGVSPSPKGKAGKGKGPKSG